MCRLKPACLIALMTGLLSLSGCFDTGNSEGRGLVVLNGSMLKGTITHADVSVFNSKGGLMWQGTSDAHGQFQAQYATSLNQLASLVITVTQESQIQCDATRCVAPLSAKEYIFGEFMPGNEFGSVSFRNSVYLEAADGSSDVREATRQVNGVSSLVMDVIDNQLVQNLTHQAYQQLALRGSAAVIVALGLPVNQPNNILQMTLPDITQDIGLNNTTRIEAILGLVNAAQAANIALLPQFSEAIIRFANSPQDTAAKAVISEIQQLYLREAQHLASQMAVNDAALMQDIEQAVVNGVNFAVLAQAVNTIEISNISASNSHYSGRLNQTAGQWWWVSASGSGQDEWVQLDYSEAFYPAQIEIGLYQRFGINNPMIQGSHDGEHWEEVATVDNPANVEDYTDERNVRHIRITPDSTLEYQHYRFSARPVESAESVWLEYLCFSQTAIPQSQPQLQPQGTPCENRLEPVSSSASSYRLAAQNIASPEPNSWWVSELASGDEQWISIQYNESFVAKRANLVVKSRYQGKDPTLQGSNDGQVWIPIVKLNPSGYPGESTDEQGFRQLELSLDHGVAYSHYRYHSSPSSFVWLQFLSFNSQPLEK
ncbi:MAG: discoidin domain-containing protein [Algicola sp.]|nr:discoidin domain-containing protein [Algicola sp.]